MSKIDINDFDKGFFASGDKDSRIAEKKISPNRERAAEEKNLTKKEIPDFSELYSKLIEDLHHHIDLDGLSDTEKDSVLHRIIDALQGEMGEDMKKNIKILKDYTERKIRKIITATKKEVIREAEQIAIAEAKVALEDVSTKKGVEPSPAATAVVAIPKEKEKKTDKKKKGFWKRATALGAVVLATLTLSTSEKEAPAPKVTPEAPTKTTAKKEKALPPEPTLEPKPTVTTEVKKPAKRQPGRPEDDTISLSSAKQDTNEPTVGSGGTLEGEIKKLTLGDEKLTKKLLADLYSKKDLGGLKVQYTDINGNINDFKVKPKGNELRIVQAKNGQFNNEPFTLHPGTIVKLGNGGVMIPNLPNSSGERMAHIGDISDGTKIDGTSVSTKKKEAPTAVIRKIEPTPPAKTTTAGRKAVPTAKADTPPPIPDTSVTGETLPDSSVTDYEIDEGATLDQVDEIDKRIERAEKNENQLEKMGQEVAKLKKIERLRAQAWSSPSEINREKAKAELEEMLEALETQKQLLLELANSGKAGEKIKARRRLNQELQPMEVAIKTSLAASPDTDIVTTIEPYRAISGRFETNSIDVEAVNAEDTDSKSNPLDGATEEWAITPPSSLGKEKSPVIETKGSNKFTKEDARAFSESETTIDDSGKKVKKIKGPGKGTGTKFRPETEREKYLKLNHRLQQELKKSFRGIPHSKNDSGLTKAIGVALKEAIDGQEPTGLTPTGKRYATDIANLVKSRHYDGKDPFDSRVQGFLTELIKVEQKVEEQNPELEQQTASADTTDTNQESKTQQIAKVEFDNSTLDRIEAVVAKIEQKQDIDDAEEGQFVDDLREAIRGDALTQVGAAKITNQIFNRLSQRASVYNKDNNKPGKGWSGLIADSASKNELKKVWNELGNLQTSSMADNQVEEDWFNTTPEQIAEADHDRKYGAGQTATGHKRSRPTLRSRGTQRGIDDSMKKTGSGRMV